MLPDDIPQPDVNDEFEVADNLNDIHRKSKDTIVNVQHESKAEEYAWYHLFPYGVNGLRENWKVKITTLESPLPGQSLPA